VEGWQQDCYPAGHSANASNGSADLPFVVAIGAKRRDPQLLSRAISFSLNKIAVSIRRIVGLQPSQVGRLGWRVRPRISSWQFSAVPPGLLRWGTAAERDVGICMIEVRRLKKSIRNGNRTIEILKGIDLFIPSGQFVAIMGASGSGKSTLLGLLAGLDSPTEGDILIDGDEISRLPEDKLAEVRGRKLGFVFQSFQLIPTLTALENVLLPHELNGGGNGRVAATDLLRSVGLGDRIHHYPIQLSGGEQQRVALARAFVMQPPIIFADEPTGNLDSANGAHVLELLLQRNRSSGATLVLVTHDPQVSAHADRRVMLRDGMIVEDIMQKQAEDGPR